MVNNSCIRARQNFEPGINAKRVCIIANECLEEYNIYVGCNTFPSPYNCSGDISDYQTAIATMLAIAAENSDDGRIKVKSEYYEYRYYLYVSFPLAKRNSMHTDQAEERREFLHCIAESNGWFARISEEGRNCNLILVMPCGDERTVDLRAPDMGSNIRFVLLFQFAGLKPPKRRKNKTDDL